MKNLPFLKKTGLSLCLLLVALTAFTQNKKPIVKDTKTDKTFANTTEIHKSAKASDEQVLAEIEGDYGLGDIVRISDAPPVATFLPKSIHKMVVVSSEKAKNPIILPKSYFKTPSITGNSNTPSDKTSVETPVSSAKKKHKKDKTAHPTDELMAEKKNNEEKVKKIANPTEKPTTVSTTKKPVSKEQKDNPSFVGKKKDSNSLSSPDNKKWMTDNLASYNPKKNVSSARTHRSSTIHYDTKKSWFPFFSNKKKASAMPKTAKNNKKDRCYQF